MKHKNGFSLLEVAIILIIIGVLLAGGLTLFNILIKKQQHQKLEEKVNAVYEAIIGYVAAYKRFPALSDLGIDTKDYGSIDLVYKSATTTNICKDPVSGLLTITDNRNATSSNRVAFIVFSRGDNRCNQTGDPSGTSFTIENPQNNVVCLDNTPGSSLPYEDIVKYITIDDLRNAVCGSFSITTNSLPEGVMYQNYSATIEVTYGIMPITFSIESGSLPSGLSMNSSGNISGIPIQSGTFNFTVRAIDSINNVTTKTLSLTIQPNKPKITTEYLPYGQVNQPYCAAITVSGGKPPYSYTSSSLPSGLSFQTNCSGSCNPGGPCIYGTPTVSGGFPVTITVTDNNTTYPQSDSKTLTLTINPEISGGGSGGGGGGGGGSGGGGSTPATCTLRVTNNPMPNNTRPNLEITISNGPTNVSFSPSTGTCGPITNANGILSCQPDPITRNNTYTANLSSGNNCSAKACVIRYRGYRVYNGTGSRRDFRRPNGACVRINNGSEITTSTIRLTVSSGPVIMYDSNNRSCTGELGRVDFSWAVCTDDDADSTIKFNADGTTSDR